MKGILFNELEEMVRDRHGMEAWEDLVDSVELSSPEAIYVGPKTYPDSDFSALIGGAAALFDLPIDRVLSEFGRYLFPKLAGRFQNFIVPGMNARAFLETVDQVIHVEVKKLHPEAALPSFEYETEGPDRLVMIYRSKRQLCDLVIGQLAGVAQHFGEEILVEQTRCTKRGDDACRFELRFGTD